MKSVSSPAWHRRARKKRSKARIRIHTARATGFVPSLGDLRLLQRHHSRPAFRELLLLPMGGKSWNKWPKNTNKDREAYEAWDKGYKEPGNYARPPWRLWPGAFASPKAAVRPHYDQIPLQHAKDGRRPPALQEEETPDVILRREVQKALTSARKADHKVRRLREDRQTKEAQWIQFQKDSKAAYLQEKARYENAINQLEEEIQLTIDNGKQASLRIQALAARGPEAIAQAPAEVTDGSWEELLQDSTMTVESGFLRDAMAAAQQVQSAVGGPPLPTDGRLVPPEVAARFLQLALASLPAGGAGVTQPPMQAPTPPEPEGAATTAPTPPPTLAAPAGLDVPYLGSPQPATAAPPGTGTACTHAMASPHSGKPKERRPVKGALIQPVHTPSGAVGLADKLEKKRHAMQPFGVVQNHGQEANIHGPAETISLEEMDTDATEDLSGTRPPDTGQLPPGS